MPLFSIARHLPSNILDAESGVNRCIRWEGAGPHRQVVSDYQHGVCMAIC